MNHIDHVRHKINQLDNRVKSQAFRIIDSFRESFAATGRDAMPGEWMHEHESTIRRTLHHLILRKALWDRDDNRQQVYAEVQNDIDAKVQLLIDQFQESENPLRSRLKGLVKND